MGRSWTSRRPRRRLSRVMEEHGVDWLGLLDGDRLLGWVDGDLVDSEPIRRSRSEAIPGHPGQRLVVAIGPGRGRHQSRPGGGGRRRRGLQGNARPGGDCRGDHGMTVLGQDVPIDRLGLDRSEHGPDRRPHLAAPDVDRGLGWDRSGHLPRAGDRRSSLAVVVHADHLGHRASLHHPVAGAVRPAGARRGAERDQRRDRPHLLHAAHHHPQPGGRHRRGPRCGARGGRRNGIHPPGQVLEDGGARSPCR